MVAAFAKCLLDVIERSVRPCFDGTLGKWTIPQHVDALVSHRLQSAFALFQRDCRWLWSRIVAPFGHRVQIIAYCCGEGECQPDSSAIQGHGSPADHVQESPDR